MIQNQNDNDPSNRNWTYHHINSNNTSILPSSLTFSNTYIHKSDNYGRIDITVSDTAATSIFTSF